MLRVFMTVEPVLSVVRLWIAALNPTLPWNVVVPLVLTVSDNCGVVLSVARRLSIIPLLPFERPLRALDHHDASTRWISRVGEATVTV